MPAGVSWGQYLRYCTAAMLSMMAGAQTVHVLYRPLDDMDKLVEAELEQLKKEFKSEVQEKYVKEVMKT